MRRAFADTAYWLAVARPRDQWTDAATRARAALGEHVLVTTDEVLTEFTAGVARLGPRLRGLAVDTIHEILCDTGVTVVPRSRDSFLSGLELYQQRLDKTYSLTDCISMQAMRAQGLSDVLTNDRHFEQEGFRVLMARQDV
jgi:predicted nucleic acid-binding protein